jgi:DNA-binding GntR family transcriptional regulator
VQNIPLSTQEHAAIVEAVAARDEQRASALLIDHVLVSRSRLHVALGSSEPEG